MSDSFGKNLIFTSLGGSHDPVMRGVVKGLPTGMEIDMSTVKGELLRRSPGSYPGTTKRVEKDEVRWVKGVKADRITGGEIVFEIENTRVRKKEYDPLDGVFRPSHADYTYYMKYGNKMSAGKTKASARETVLRIVAGSLSKQYLNKYNVEVFAYVRQIGSCKIQMANREVDMDLLKGSSINCPDNTAEKEMLAKITEAEKEGDTLGGVIEAVIRNCPAGIGSPLFHKLHADLAHAMLSIPSVKAFELGEGFNAAALKGSEYNDIFVQHSDKVITLSNHDGGVQGGISNGNDIVFRIAFKPVPSIRKEQKTTGVDGQEREISIKGRHDVCAVPRACVIVESMAAMVMADHLLENEQ